MLGKIAEVKTGLMEKRISWTKFFDGHESCLNYPVTSNDKTKKHIKRRMREFQFAVFLLSILVLR